MQLVGAAASMVHPRRLAMATLLHLFLALTALQCCSFAQGAFDRQHSWEDEGFTRQAQTKRLPHQPRNGDAIAVVHPVRSDENGRFVSHQLRPSRTKRDTERKLFYWLHAFGEDFHLQLAPNTGLLAPGFTVYTRQSDNGSFSERTRVEHPQSDCLLVGHDQLHHHSVAAVSNCHGLQGMIRTDSHDYLIEPLDGQEEGPEEPLPHIIYKRSPKSTETESSMHSIPKLHRGTENHFCGAKNEFMPKRPKHNIFLPGEYPSPLRSRRSLGRRPKFRDRNVETLVVVDSAMVKAHGVHNVTTYVLTIFNMVAALYNDGTIGNNISVVLVALVLLEGDEPGLVLNNNAERSLHSFCQWQSTLRDANGSHHDHAILLTGLDICSWKNEPCDTLGYAPISGMCSKYRSCTINEDTGLALAFTIAHESGHNFGMVHDGDGNVCGDAQGSIMSPTLAGLDGTFSWSVCSRKDLTKFLVSSQSTCLENEPRHLGEFKFPDVLPGELYDADMQCKWQFGKKSKLCMFEFGKDICKALWCQKTGRQCETKFLPAAEGTSCGSKKWCRRGVCVDYGNNGPGPVEGQWSDWSEWSTCTRTCGGGVTYQERECNNPRPRYGGKYCEGDSRRHKMCNIQSCPSETADFRAEQCSAFNSRPFRGSFYRWQPYSKGLSEHMRCKLYCMPEGLDFFFAMASKVIDGTSCLSDSTNVCIDGECKEVGCDYIIGSPARLDACGICNGDNSTCIFIQGNYTEQPANNNYYTVVTIPLGARSIHVWEVNMSASYLAIRNTEGIYYLTGDWTVDWPGRYRVGQAVFSYRRPYNGPESLFAEGPLDQEVVVELLLQGVNPGVGYEYTLPDTNRTRPEIYHSHPYHYVWRATMSQCTESCAGGQMETTAQCFRNDDQEVESHFCDLSSKPDEGLSACNAQPCPPKWSVEPWSECSRTCGGGRQKRRVRCRVKLNATQEINVKARLCRNQLRPVRKQRCNVEECPPLWHTSQWSQCSRSCGGGMQKRNVTCQGIRKKSVHFPDKMCKNQERPEDTRRCNLRRCFYQRMAGHWVASAWGKCSRSCGGGQQMRLVQCVDRLTHRGTSASVCKSALRPKRVQTCNVRSCPSTLALQAQIS